MTDRIKKLSVQGFRGATQPFELQFDSSKPVVLIFGENGTGKSTIVDALECVGSGSTAFLDDWKLGKGKRKEAYIPTLGKTLTDVKISLEFGNKTYSATLNAGGIGLCNTPNRPQTKVLRRKSLQAFIDAEPAQRYKEVATFLDIPQIVASEASLRQAYKRAKDTFDSATSANRQAQETLHGLWEAEGSPGLSDKTFNTAEAWARSQAKLEVESLEQELTGIRTGVKHCENVLRNFQSYEQAINEFKQAEEKLKFAQQQLAKLEADDAKSNAQLVTLLEDAKDYLQVNPDKLCPVCEQTEIEADSLVKRLQQRIEGMDSLKQANAAIKSVKNNHKTKSELLKRAENSLLNAAESAQNHFEKELSDKVSIKVQREKDLPHVQSGAVALATAVKIDLSAKQPDMQVKLDELQKQVHTLTSIKQLVLTLDEKAGEAKQAEQVQLKLGQAVVIFESKRKAYVETVLIEIAQSVDELYQKIHPHEKIGNLKLKLDEKQRGSLIYGVAFKDKQDAPPQPYYSESHLDTLGLCIFLALAKRGGADKAIVILDDVLGSVDQQHLNRTLQMILEESGSFAQIVMTTHYRPLRDRFRYAYNPVAPVQLIELKPWNFEQGIRSGKTKLYVEELRQQLKEDDFRRDVIASQAGQLFENLLEFISRTYRCKVPHLIEPRFTFGDLASAPNKELKKALKTVKQINDDETTETKLLPIYEKLTEAINVRNLVGCHFNQLAGELGDQDIRDMAELALELADTLICEHCGGLPVSNKSGSHWECSCKKTQMYPLQQPQK